ncbi:hypothetical protein BT69DRAFT_1031974 [Atractiella rhizophila]|nr:hypothetical protein BT69DRAFT_1031974 [Atractiella rhizophila]
MAAPSPEFLMFTPKLYGEVLRPIFVSVVLSFCLWGYGLSQFHHCFSILNARRPQPQKIKMIALELSVLLVVDVIDSVSKLVWSEQFIRGIILHGLSDFILPDHIIVVLFVLSLHQLRSDGIASGSFFLR